MHIESSTSAFIQSPSQPNPSSWISDSALLSVPIVLILSSPACGGGAERAFRERGGRGKVGEDNLERMVYILVNRNIRNAQNTPSFRPQVSVATSFMRNLFFGPVRLAIHF